MKHDSSVWSLKTRVVNCHGRVQRSKGLDLHLFKACCDTIGSLSDNKRLCAKQIDVSAPKESLKHSSQTSHKTFNMRFIAALVSIVFLAITNTLAEIAIPEGYWIKDIYEPRYRRQHVAKLPPRWSPLQVLLTSMVAHRRCCLWSSFKSLLFRA